MIANILATVPSGFSDIVSSWDKLFYQIIIPIMFICMGSVLVVVGIWRGSKIALADNEESKKKATKSLLWWLIGIVLVFALAMLGGILWTELSETFVVPTTNPSL